SDVRIRVCRAPGRRTWGKCAPPGIERFPPGGEHKGDKRIGIDTPGAGANRKHLGEVLLSLGSADSPRSRGGRHFCRTRRSPWRPCHAAQKIPCKKKNRPSARAKYNRLRRLPPLIARGRGGAIQKRSTPGRQGHARGPLRASKRGEGSGALAGSCITRLEP